jgi:predicted RNA binding protein YcfA (HicA-like mRNA interferase family)
MPPLPVVSGRKAAAVFERIGYHYFHQRGSHMIYRKPGSKKLSIPDHKELDRGLLSNLIKDAGISVEQFVDLLKGK